ncbi:metallophosphoesterase family protein [soil metagenome]
MRILLVSDIHANAVALAAIQEPHDLCVCLGDIVEYGPSPAASVQWVREQCGYCVRGNHDHGTAQNVEITGIGGFRYLTGATRTSTIAMLSDTDRRYLADLPTTKLVALNGKRFLFVHASPRDPLDEYVPAEASAWAARLNGWDVDYLCVGHTHQPFTLEVGKTRVVNPGSVGLQRDGDPRARYAIIEPDGSVVLKQIAYDIDALIREVNASPFEAKAKAMLIDVYRSGKYLHPTTGMMNGYGSGHADTKVKAIA